MHTTSSKKRRNRLENFGSVRFTTEVEASRALKRNDDLEVKGKKIVIRWAKYDRDQESILKINQN